MDCSEFNKDIIIILQQNSTSKNQSLLKKTSPAKKPKLLHMTRPTVDSILDSKEVTNDQNRYLCKIFINSS